MVCDNTNSTTSNAIFEINKLKDQLQGKDDTIRNLQTQINITRMLNVGSTVELSETNTHSRDELTGKITALTAENAKLKTELISKIGSGSIACEKPKVLAPGMYAISPKYIPPQRRVNRAVPTPLPKNQQVTFKKPPIPSNRPTQKTVVQQNKKPNVPVNLTIGVKPATGASKPMSLSSATLRNLVPFAARPKSKKERGGCVVRTLKSVKSVYPKTPKAKHNMKTTKKVWKAKVVASVKPQWKPTGQYFTLYDKYSLTRIVEPIVEPLELTPCVYQIVLWYLDVRMFRQNDRFGWVRFLRTKDETPEVLKKFIVTTQRALNATVRYHPLFTLAEAIYPLACYTLNRSLIHTLHGKTYYELLKGKKPELKYFRVFGSLCYPTNDYDDLGKLKAKADIGIFVGYAPTKKAYRIFNKRTRKIQETVHVTFDELSEGLTSVQSSTGLEPNPMAPMHNGAGPKISALHSGRSRSELVNDPTTPSVPPSAKQLEELFQPLFDDDEEFPPAVQTPPVQDAPAAITISLESQTPPLDTGVTGIETLLPTNDSDLFEPYIAPDIASATSSSGTIIVDVTLNSLITHVQKWTKDHPLENMIGDLHRPVSTRQQLETDAMWCFFNEFLTHVEPKNYKQALEHSCWIEAIQAELHEFERLDV
ncbi:retrovirus-related pol polyprotein from transposon TNT 1-94 [Tanacetum coccineum]